MCNYSAVLVICIMWEGGGQAMSCVAHHPSRNSHCQPQAFSSAEPRLYQCRKITDNLEKQNCDPWHLASAAVWNSSSHRYVAVLVLPSWWVVWTLLFLEHFFAVSFFLLWPMTLHTGKSAHLCPFCPVSPWTLLMIMQGQVALETFSPHACPACALTWFGCVCDVSDTPTQILRPPEATARFHRPP